MQLVDGILPVPVPYPAWDEPSHQSSVKCRFLTSDPPRISREYSSPWLNIVNDPRFVWPDGLPRPSLHGDPTVTLRQMWACPFHCVSCVLATRPLCPLFLQLHGPPLNLLSHSQISEEGLFIHPWGACHFCPLSRNVLPSSTLQTHAHSLFTLGYRSSPTPERWWLLAHASIPYSIFYTCISIFCVPFCLSPEINSPFLDCMLEMLGNYKYLTYYYVAQSESGFLKTPRWF